MANNNFHNGNNFSNISSTTFNTNTSHPLIPNSQEYMFYKKYVSIHSEDRNSIKFPNPAEFEIEIPEDMLNVSALRLISWSFPANYNTFSSLNNNVTLTFRINNPYNPNINGVSILIYEKIFEYLFLYQDNYFEIIIENGFYNPQQMVNELTNKMNYVVTQNLISYFTIQSTNPSLTVVQQEEYVVALNELNNIGGYNNFTVVYNNVSQKIWFGNTSDQFILTNETQLVKNKERDNLYCNSIKEQFSDFSDWGLPGNLGLSRCDTNSSNEINISNISNIVMYNGINVPRFFYGDVNSVDNGYWLLPNPILTNSNVYWVECPYKINLMGPGFMYMEIAGQNCIDETAPFNISKFTLETNSTNGTVNSAFAKIAIPSTPLSQWFDRDSLPYKFYYPPAERMRRFYIKLRYHNGQTVNFGVFNYSFVIEFTLQMPQILRSSRSIVYPPTFNN
jgi:Fe-S cluster biosynthesis and repair protein YggX